MFKLVETCSKWLKFVQSGHDLFKLVETCKNWSKLDHIGLDLSEIVLNGPSLSNWSIFVEIGQNFQIGQNLSKFL